MDNRGLSTVVEKLLSLSIVVLYISLLTTVLYGGAVPSYRGAVGAELGERTLSEATARVEQTVPPAARSGDATRRVDLPGTIEGTTYTIRADNGSLVLDHPHPDVGGRTRPILPPRVSAIEGQWTSGGPLVVSVTGNRTNVTVRLGGPA